jgi:hypothetical protein
MMKRIVGLLALLLAGCSDANENVNRLAQAYKENASSVKNLIAKAAPACSKKAMTTALGKDLPPNFDDRHFRKQLIRLVTQKIEIRARLGENASRDDEFGAMMDANMNDPAAADDPLGSFNATTDPNQIASQQKATKIYLRAEEEAAQCIVADAVAALKQKGS